MPFLVRRLRAIAPMVVAIAFGAAVLSLAAPHVGPPWLLITLAVLALLWVAVQPGGAERDDTLPALAVAIASVGLLLVARLSPDLAARQIWLLAFSLVLAIVAGPALTRFRVLAAYTYIWIVVAVALFVALAIFGDQVNGARLWIRIAGVQFEPVEVIKLLIVLFMAAYLAGTADVIARTKPWSLRANAKYLGPLFIGWGLSMMILVFERDLGMATLLFATFAAMLYVATRRVDLIVGCTAIFAGAATWAALHYPYVHARIAVWRDPFADPYGAGYQTVQSLYALAAGGLFGAGYHAGHPEFIPAVATDYVYAAYTEEWGAIGAIVLCLAFLALILRTLTVAERAPDLYAKLLATGLAVTLGFQVVIIVGGVLRLFPLTGITLPFVSYGGSSLVTNFLLVALVWAISAERRRVTA
jgi:cell division protein FtsW (lipid II flippase)